MSGPARDEQDLFLEEAFGFAAEQRFYLRKAIQQNDMENALRYSICLTNELRSSMLQPNKYYQLYALVFWELQHLGAFVGREERHGHRLADVYEMVQYEGNVLPRLYLLVTVGAVYMREVCDPALAKGILEDLGEMLDAVQHPVRGLFLRYYLLQMVKDKLRELDSTRDALQYLLRSLREAISLWSRLRLSDGQPTPGGLANSDYAEGDASSDLPSPAASPAAAAAGDGGACHQDADDAAFSTAWLLDRNRHSLRFLVGAHLMHIARLDSLTLELYKELVLPEVLRVSNSCEDAAGQAYLLECFVEVFPDRFHLGTLDVILAASGQVHWVVDLRPLLQHLLQRITMHIRELDEDAGPPLDAFAAFHAHLERLHGRPRSPATPTASLLALQLELGMTALALHPGDAVRAEMVLRGTAELLAQRSGDPLDAASQAAVVDILAAPLTQGCLVPAVLEMPHHAALMARLGRAGQREAALKVITAVLHGDVPLVDRPTVQRLLALCGRLMRDSCGEYSDAAHARPGDMRHLEHDPDAFAAEQVLIARLVHQVRHPEVAEVFKMLVAMRGTFSRGGPHRLVFTAPAMVVAALRLASRIGGEAARRGQGPTPHELFEFVHSTCASLGSLAPRESLRLWLLCAATVERADWGTQFTEMGAACSRFVESALLCLERDVVEPQARFRGLQLLVGTLSQATCLDEPAFGLATDRAMRIGGDLPAKRLQSRALCLCAGLFWCRARREAHGALRCLRQALKLADAAVHIDPLAVDLFVEVLDQAARLFGEGNVEVSAPLLSSLLALCIQHARYVEARVPAEPLRALQASVEDLRAKQAEALKALDEASTPEAAKAVSRFADLVLHAPPVPPAVGQQRA